MSNLELLLYIFISIASISLIICAIISGKELTSYKKSGFLNIIMYISCSIFMVFTVASVCLAIPIDNVCSEMNDRYDDYIELKDDVNDFYNKNVFEQMDISNRVNKYNIWYDKTKHLFENEWSFHHCSIHAGEFDYIYINNSHSN